MTRIPIHSAALVTALSVLAAVLAVAAPAQAHRTITMYEYQGPHPSPDEHSAWCNEQDLHAHPYHLDPEQYLIYEINGVYHFVGDAYLHQSGHHNWYYDPHPISHISTHWCVMEGPHSHHWRPSHYGHHYVSWVSNDGYWLWQGAYDSAFWWTWATWYSPFAALHSRRVSHHRRYHPARHYHQVDHHRPRYDGRHRHNHQSDHRMRNARERHSRWRAAPNTGSSQHRLRGSSQRHSTAEREHDGPSRVSDERPHSASNSSSRSKAREGGSSYQLPDGARRAEKRSQTQREGGEASPTPTRSSGTKSGAKSSSGRSSAPSYGKGTSTTGTSRTRSATPNSSSNRSSNSGSSRSRSSSTSSSKARTTAPSSSRSGSSSSPSSSTSSSKARTTTPSSSRSGSSSSRSSSSRPSSTSSSKTRSATPSSSRSGSSSSRSSSTRSSQSRSSGTSESEQPKKRSRKATTSKPRESSKSSTPSSKKKKKKKKKGSNRR